VGSWPAGVSVVTLSVGDLGAARRSYRDVFGLPVQFEDDDSVVFDFGNVLVNLLVITGGPPAWSTRYRSRRLAITHPRAAGGPGDADISWRTRLK
jgi:hypothetical protein